MTAPISSRCLFRLVLLLSVLGFATPAAADDRPNIILLMGDDHGWDETGYNGHPHLVTPVLDRMAAVLWAASQ